jgi:hypothetical protein
MGPTIGWSSKTNVVEKNTCTSLIPNRQEPETDQYIVTKLLHRARNSRKNRNNNRKSKTATSTRGGTVVGTATGT